MTENPERYREIRRKWQEKNREKCREYCRKWREKKKAKDEP